MPPSFLTGGNNAAVKHFQIRVDEDHIVLRGTAHEAASVRLKGSLVLCSSEPLRVQGIHLSFKGLARTAANIYTASGSRVPKQDVTFFVKRWDFDNQNENKKQHKVLEAGNHEWPFEVVLSGDLPESVEGMPLSWIVYRMKATVDRGVFAKDLETHKHIRLIRTFDIGSLELAHNMAVSNTWPNKIQYDISTPTKSVVFGTKVRVDFTLMPLLKGLGIGPITSCILESQEVTIETKDIHRTKKEERTVAKDIYSIPDYVESQEIEGQEGYQFSRYVQLPRKLQGCLQSVEEKNISIKHQLKFTVALQNPDGHISELRATLPLQIFISPDVRLNEQNEVTSELSTTEDLIQDSLLAPPSYNEANLDRLYDGVDPSGFMTPGVPGTPFALSRRGSAEDVSMDALANMEVSANTLRNRLADLDLETTDWNTGRRSAVSGPSTPGPGTPSHPHSEGLNAASHPPGGQALSPQPISRIQSCDRFTPPRSGSQTPSLPRSGHQSPVHVEYNISELARVPSYNTAVHSNPRTPYSTDLPDYFSVTGSRPPTPPSGSGSRSVTPAPEAGNGQPTTAWTEAVGSVSGTGSAAPARGRAGGRRAHFADNEPEEVHVDRPQPLRSASQRSNGERPSMFGRNSFLSSRIGRH